MPRKMENEQLISPSRQCSSTPVGFGKVLLSKDQCDNTAASPILAWPGSSWFLPVPSIKISIMGRRFCDATGIIKNATEELKRLSQNGFHECFQHLYSHWRKGVVAKGAVLKEMYLKWLNCYVGLFLRNKAIPGTFWSYHVKLIASIATCLQHSLSKKHKKGERQGHTQIF